MSGNSKSEPKQDTVMHEYATEYAAGRRLFLHILTAYVVLTASVCGLFALIIESAWDGYPLYKLLCYSGLALAIALARLYKLFLLGKTSVELASWSFIIPPPTDIAREIREAVTSNIASPRISKDEVYIHRIRNIVLFCKLYRLARSAFVAWVVFCLLMGLVLGWIPGLACFLGSLIVITCFYLLLAKDLENAMRKYK